MRAAAAIVAMALVFGCGGRAGHADVAVSIFPLYDVTRRIAGDRLAVALVLPPGRSEHAFEPAPRDLARLADVKLGLVVGLDLDRWAENVMRTAGGARIVHLGEGVPTLPIAEGGAPDPHFWMDPHRMLGVADRIARELAAIDPAGRDVFAANAREVKARLVVLDRTIAARTATWSKHAIVTFHGSMAYYAQRYGLRIVAVVERIAGKEPTAADLAGVLAAIARSGAAGVFAEPQLDRAPGETLAREAGVPLGELDPIGGVPGRDSYEALLLWNTDQLERVLQ